MSFASSSQAFGFGELVMEQSVAEENEDEDEEAEADVSGLAGQESILSEMDRADKSDLLTVSLAHRSPLMRWTVADIFRLSRSSALPFPAALRLAAIRKTRSSYPCRCKLFARR